MTEASVPVAVLGVGHYVPERVATNDLLAPLLGTTSEVKNIGRVGNTSAASIPIALSEAMASGQICKGHRVLLLGFGSGFTWGGCLFQY